MISSRSKRYRIWSVQAEPGGRIRYTYGRVYHSISRDGDRSVYHLSRAILDELLCHITLHRSIGIKAYRYEPSICALATTV